MLELYPDSEDKPDVRCVFTRDYRVDWGRVLLKYHKATSPSEEQYLTWFFADVNGDGKLDLISLVDAAQGPTVLLFPGLDGFAFGDPQTSIINSDKGSLFNASFMKPVIARQAKCPLDTDPVTITNGAVLQVFDNYGIMGVRLMGPVMLEGSRAYEVKGQVPAIAGQISQGLGTVSIGNPQEAIGVFIE